jgi:SAM-dependent methyltransferase
MFKKLLTHHIDQQYRRPSGIVGRYIGQRMASDHWPENQWTISLVQPQPTDHVLELGCGSGVALQELARSVTHGQIVGVDYSKTMVQAARKRNKTAVQQGRVTLYYGDARCLPFPPDTFDKALSIHSIYFWRQPVVILLEVWRVLKLGGVLILTVLPKERWNPSDPDAPVGTLDCIPYAGSELQTLLMTAGFRDIHIRSDTGTEHRSNYSVIGVK